MLLCHPTTPRALTLDDRGRLWRHDAAAETIPIELEAPAQVIGPWDEERFIVGIEPPVLELRRWDDGSLSERMTLTLGESAKRWTHLSSSAQHERIVVAADARTVAALNHANQRMTRVLHRDGQRVAALALSPTRGARIAALITSPGGGFIRVWAIRDGQLHDHIRILDRRGVEAPTSELARTRATLLWHPDGERLFVLASCPDNGAWPHEGWRAEVSAYDCEAGRLLWTAALDARALGDARSLEVMGYEDGAPGALLFDEARDELWCGLTHGMIVRLDARDGAMHGLELAGTTRALTGLDVWPDGLLALHEDGGLLRPALATQPGAVALSDDEDAPSIDRADDEEA